MREITMRDVDDYADEILPVDGPHTPEGVLAAAGLIAELVRRLNHATLPHRTERSLPYPSTVNSVVSRLHGAAALLPQTLEQLAGRLRGLAESPDLCDDRYDSAPMTADMVAVMAAAVLSNEARRHTGNLADRLAYACRYTNHLGIRE